MDMFEKAGDPGLRYDDTGHPPDPNDTSELEHEAQLALVGGMNKYHTLAELRALQDEMAKLMVAHPRLRPDIERYIDRRALEIIDNGLRTLKDESDVSDFVASVHAYPFYGKRTQTEAYRRVLGVVDGMRNV